MRKRKKAKGKKGVDYLSFIMGLIVGIVLFSTFYWVNFYFQSQFTLGEIEKRSISENPTGEISKVPEYRLCSSNEECGSTCCGCVNHKFDYMLDKICNKTCSPSELRVCLCQGGICVQTNIPLPMEAWPSEK